MPTVAPAVWRCKRTLAGMQAAVEATGADDAPSNGRRGARRHECWPEPGRAEGRVRWSIDGELVLELRIPPTGPAELIVHDFSLIDPLRRAVRTRHVRLR